MVAACQPWYSRPCLSSNDPRTADTRRAWAEAADEHLPWSQRVCAVEGVTSHFRDYTDRSDEPQCRAELASELSAALFAHAPVRFDRLQVARIVAVSRIWDTAEVMPYKAKILSRLAELSDDDIEDYRLAPGEVGPAPPKEWLRRLSLYLMTGSNLFLNVAAARQYEVARRARARDDVERRILYNVLAQLFENAVWGHPKRAEDNGSFAMFDLLLRDIDASVLAPYDPLSFDLLVDHLALAGTYAKRFGRGPQTVTLVSRILPRNAAVPACAGQPAACRDLLAAATRAREDAQADLDRLMPTGTGMPSPERTRFEWWVPLIDVPLYGHGVDCRPKRTPEPQPGWTIGERSWRLAHSRLR